MGYSDKATELLKAVVSTLTNACPTQEQFNLYKELIARDYVNTLNANPLKEGKELLWSLLFKDFAGLPQKSSAITSISYEQMDVFCQSLFRECYVEGMLYGNITLEESKVAWAVVKEAISSLPYPPVSHSKIELGSLPSQDSSSYLVLKSKNPSNALILTADCGDFSFKRRAAQEILTKGLEEPFFSELRTKQQTAYVVANWSLELERHLYSFFAIQSSSHVSRDLLARFELFIESSLQNLTDKVLPEDRFESIRAAFIRQLQHPAENLKKMGSLLHTFAFQYDGDFDWMDKRINGFQELTYKEFIEYAQEFLGKENKRRLAICVNGSVPQKNTINYRRAITKEKLRSEICYERRKAL